MMQRIKFIQTSALRTGLACLPGAKLFAGINGELYPELKKQNVTTQVAYASDYLCFMIKYFTLRTQN